MIVVRLWSGCGPAVVRLWSGACASHRVCVERARAGRPRRHRLPLQVCSDLCVGRRQIYIYGLRNIQEAKRLRSSRLRDTLRDAAWTRGTVHAQARPGRRVERWAHCSPCMYRHSHEQISCRAASFCTLSSGPSNSATTDTHSQTYARRFCTCCTDQSIGSINCSLANVFHVAVGVTPAFSARSKAQSRRRDSSASSATAAAAAATPCGTHAAATSSPCVAAAAGTLSSPAPRGLRRFCLCCSCATGSRYALPKKTSNSLAYCLHRS